MLPADMTELSIISPKKIKKRKENERILIVNNKHLLEGE
jgi:hypothetical protein